MHFEIKVGLFALAVLCVLAVRSHLRTSSRGQLTRMNLGGGVNVRGCGVGHRGEAGVFNADGSKANRGASNSYRTRSGSDFFRLNSG